MAVQPRSDTLFAAVERPQHFSRLDHLARRVVASSGERLIVRSPFDGEPIGEVPRSTPADVAAAAAKARAAQESWALISFEERGRIFLRLHDRLLDRQDEVLDLIQLESGKARAHAHEEVVDAALVSRYYARRAPKLLAPSSRKGLVPGVTQSWEYRHPKGLVTIVAPWNYPLSMGLTDAIPALLAGNAILEKPDSQTPFTLLWALDLLIECGLPAELYQVVCGDGPTLGPALIGEADYIQFTGSTATGRTIARQAGELLTGCSLELGGKNPMLVLADADLDAAVSGAVRSSFASAGQLCVSTERLYVHESLHDRFLSAFVAKTKALRLGRGLEWSYDIGSLVSAKQFATVSGQVADAVEKGASVEAGGRARSDLGPFFFEPTILTGVTSEMTLYREETFGPVVSLYPFASNHEAIERANDTRYGLNASIWSRDTELARRMATRLACGTVTVNETYVAGWGSLDAPMGGFKQSGLGRRHGAEGILKYTESQNVTVQRGVSLAAPKGVPAEAFAKAMTGAVRVLKRVPGVS